MTEPARHRARPIRMRRPLGTLLASLALAATAACGTTSSTTAGRPASPSAGPIAGAQVLPLISQTGAGGRVSTWARPLDTPAHVRAFTDQFRVPGMAHRINSAVARAEPRGHILMGAVVSVGCDRPPGADVVLDGSGRVQIVPHEVASPLPECLAPVTTVAIADIPGSD